MPPKTSPRATAVTVVAVLGAALFTAACNDGGAPRSAPEPAPAPVAAPAAAASPAAPAAAPAAPAATPAAPAAQPVPADTEPPAAATVQPFVPPAEVTDGPVAITYPRQGTLFPPESVAPTFTWQGGGKDAVTWTIVVHADEGDDLRFTAGARRWRPSEDDWKTMKKRSLERDIEITVKAGDAADATAKVRIRTSIDPVGDSLFYREVPLPFLSAVQDPSRIRWRFGTIDNQESPPIVLQNLPVCGNCHSFADNGSALGLDVDYGNDKGAYAVIDTAKDMVLNDSKIITWADFRKEDGELTFGLLSRVSPTGRYVISTVKDRSVFVAIPDLWFSQLFFPIKGILVVYDREKKTFTELPGADDPQYVQTNAVWSPDGEEIVFARAKAYKPERLEQKNAALIDEKDVPEFTRDHQPFRYDLMRIPFHDGKGGKAVPIEGASNNGSSNYFAKFSPDGKWIVFTKSSSYMLLQPDSELWIMPAKGGKARRLDANTARMNSWHSWSSNSRWLVFSSKANTPYTQLFLTHIDDNGVDSPPVLLERFTSPDRAANIPEFVKLPGDAITQIKEEFLDAYSFLRAGMANEHTGDHKGAERAFRRGLEVNPDNAELHNALGWTLFQDGRTGDAVREYQRALEIDPKHVKSHNNLALALVELERLPQAAEQYRLSVELEPKAEIYSDLGFILARLNKNDEAVAQYRKALELDPNCASAHFNLAVDAVRRADYTRAEAHYRDALAAKPNAETWNGLGYALNRQRRNEDALEAFRRAVELDPAYTPALNNMGDALARLQRFDESEAVYRRSLEMKPSIAVSNNRGGVLRKLGRDADAVQQFKFTLTMDATNAEAVRNLKELEKKP